MRTGDRNENRTLLAHITHNQISLDRVLRVRTLNSLLRTPIGCDTRRTGSFVWGGFVSMKKSLWHSYGNKFNNFLSAKQCICAALFRKTRALTPSIRAYCFQVEREVLAGVDFSVTVPTSQNFLDTLAVRPLPAFNQ